MARVPFPASPCPFPCFPPSPSLLPPIPFPASPSPLPCFPKSPSLLPQVPFPASPCPFPCFPPSPSLLPPIPFPASPHSLPCFPPSPSLLPQVHFHGNYTQHLMLFISSLRVLLTLERCEEDEEEQPCLALVASMETHTEEERGEVGRWARWGARWGHGPMQGSRDDANRAAEGQEQQGAWAGGASEEFELPVEPSVRIPASRRIAIRCPDGTRLQCRFRAQTLSPGAIPIPHNNLLATHPTPVDCPSCHAHSLALPLTPLFSHAPLPTPPAAGKQIHDWICPEANPLTRTTTLVTKQHQPTAHFDRFCEIGRAAGRAVRQPLLETAFSLPCCPIPLANQRPIRPCTFCCRPPCVYRGIGSCKA
ncbi:unnamed protein product [Closterium sp. Naga37s-1]|nr:unnamed protein product [Closterium sp. Naga37s-1]